MRTRDAPYAHKLLMFGFQHKSKRSKRKQSDTMPPRTSNSPKADLVGTEIQGVTGKELKTRQSKCLKNSKKKHIGKFIRCLVSLEKILLNK